MGAIKDKFTSWIKNAAETATETVKDIAKEDTSKKLDMLGNIAKIGIFTILTISAFKSPRTTSQVVQTVAASDVLEPVARTAQTAAPVVQIFLGEGKGVHIE